MAGLQVLFDHFEYGETIVSGTRWRNLHFVFTQGLTIRLRWPCCGAFMDAVAELMPCALAGRQAGHGTGLHGPWPL